MAVFTTDYPTAVQTFALIDKNITYTGVSTVVKST